MRWTHPAWGPVTPDELIEAVEPTEVMHLLTCHMLDRVCAQIAAWNERGLRVRVAVNASIQDLQESRLRGADPGRAAPLRRAGAPADDRDHGADGARRHRARRTGGPADRRARSWPVARRLRHRLRLDPAATHPAIDRGEDRQIVCPGDDQQRGPARDRDQRAPASPARYIWMWWRRASKMHQRPRRSTACLGRIGQGWHFGHPVTADAFAEQWQPTRAAAVGHPGAIEGERDPLIS